MQLVLSLFPGIDLLGYAFKQEGFCVVQGGDVIYGGDIRDEHYPAGKFDGVIGGPPCQAFSSLAAIVRANGHEPEFGNLIPEFERVVEECQPMWFAMENVPAAPLPSVENYGVHSFVLNNRQCVDENGKPATASRSRRWSFGWRGDRVVLMLDVVCFENPVFEYAAVGGSHGPMGLAIVDRKSKRKPSSVREAKARQHKKGDLPFNSKGRRDFADICRKQGLSIDYDLPGLTVAAKCKAVGNAVPSSMGRAIAKAVKEVTETDNAHRQGVTAMKRVAKG